MDTMSFVAALVESLAWPVAALVALWLLRGPLIDLLPNARRLKWNELEIEFEQDVAELKQEAARALPATGPGEPPLSEGNGMREKLGAVAALSPNRAVLDAWRAVEQAALPLLEAHQLQVGPSITRYKAMERLLEQHALLDKGRLKLFRDLRRLRNKVRHARDFHVSEDQALEYVDVALSLRAALMRDSLLPEPSVSAAS